MLSLQCEVFLLLLTGYILDKKGMLTDSTRDQLTDIVIDIILPCSIVKSFEMELSAEVLLSTAQILLAAVGIQIFYWILNRFLYRSFSEDEQIACKYSTMVTNASFIGMPIASELYGPMGLLYSSIFVLPQRIFMWAYGLPMYTTVRKQDIVRKVVTHPCVFSIFLGIGVMILYSNGVVLPDAVSNTLAALGNCTTALCLLIIGSILSDLKPAEMICKRALLYSFYRLLLIPLVLAVVLRFLPFDDLSRHICVLMSAMPAPTTAVILAQKYDRDPKFASKLMVASTLLSLVTLPVITAAMNFMG